MGNTLSQPLPARRLASLKPRWLLEPYEPGRHSRYGLGVEFDCPWHPWTCRLAFYFLEPDDKGPPGPDLDGSTVLYGHSYLTGMHPFDGLTLWTATPEKDFVLEKTNHWRGRVRDGWVYDARAGEL